MVPPPPLGDGVRLLIDILGSSGSMIALGVSGEVAKMELDYPEIVSAFAGKVRTGEISAADFDLSTQRFAADARKKSFTTIRLLARHFKEAERQIRQHGLTMRLRTLDALQLAVALDLQARGIVTDFVCSDHSLLSVASAEGLSVIDPEKP